MVVDVSVATTAEPITDGRSSAASREVKAADRATGATRGTITKCFRLLDQSDLPVSVTVATQPSPENDRKAFARHARRDQSQL